MFKNITFEYILSIKQFIIFRIRSMKPKNDRLLSEEWNERFKHQDIIVMLVYYYLVYDHYMEHASQIEFEKCKSWVIGQIHTYLMSDTALNGLMIPFQTFEDYLDQSMNAEIDVHSMSSYEYHHAMQSWNEKTQSKKFRDEYEKQEQHKILRNSILYESTLDYHSGEYFDAIPYYDYVSQLSASVVERMKTAQSDDLKTILSNKSITEMYALKQISMYITENI